MVRLIRDSVVLDKGVADFTAQLLEDAGLDAHSEPSEIFRCIYECIRNNIRYISDAAGRIEKLKDARTTLQDGYGDCDDQTVTICTMLAVIGFEPKIALAKYTNNQSANFQHVYPVVYADGERFVLDTTLPEEKAGFNEEVAPSVIEEIGVFDYLEGVDDIKGMVNGFRDVIRETGHNALGMAGEISSMLPIGAIPAHILSAGASMLGRAGIQDYSDTETLSETGSRILGKIHDIIIDLQNGRIAVEVARARAKAETGGLYWYDTKVRETDEFKFIESQVNKKLEYIENYGKVDPRAVTLNQNAMLYIGVLAVGAVLFLALKGE